MEAVIDRAVTRRLLVPERVLVEDLLVGVLHHEVDDGGRAAPGCGPRPCFEGVARLGAAEGHLHVGMCVDPARNHKLAGGIDDGVDVRLDVEAEQRGAGRKDGGDGLTVDQYVGCARASRVHDRAVLDERLHDFSFITSSTRGNGYGFGILVYDSGRRSR